MVLHVGHDDGCTVISESTVARSGLGDVNESEPSISGSPQETPYPTGIIQTTFLNTPSSFTWDPQVGPRKVAGMMQGHVIRRKDSSDTSNEVLVFSATDLP